MPPKRKAPAAATKEVNDDAPAVKKRGRAKAVALPPPSRSDHEAADPPVPQRKSERKPKEIVKEVIDKPASKTKPPPKEKVVPKDKPAVKAKSVPEEKPAPKAKAAPKAKPTAKKKAAPRKTSKKANEVEDEDEGQEEEEEEEVVALKSKAPAKRKAPTARGAKKEAEVEESGDEGQKEEVAAPKSKSPAKRKAPAPRSGKKAKEEEEEEGEEDDGEDQDDDVVDAKAKSPAKRKAPVGKKKVASVREAKKAVGPKAKEEKIEDEGEAEDEEEAVAPKVETLAKRKASSVKPGKKTKEKKETEEMGSGVKPPGKGKATPPRAAKKAKNEENNSEKSESADEDGEEGTKKILESDVKSVEDAVGVKKSVIIEHCKQCNAFKIRALKVQESLKAAIPGLEVSINPEKPRRGCFEIRDSAGTIFISLQGMPRPFTKLKALDLDKTAADIVKKLT
ncbi:uncharacterized protein [Physcomitrium patens]|uniref:Selenoprotein H n=1 Tax=Physcomitrium patens TaxID=3218 RepID=A0A2K1KHF0_PHYPA|nr:nucleolin-like [Physcomitrium patens]XP_024378981.1 nucleolin-like [Physcomitrium patens]PNR53189.1 hypothetical protein PHYPA_009564 [Physcomitrium patens]|eukprot:XP_024378980.1 nucleolin-like [Physcomitrella patens]